MITATTSGIKISVTSRFEEKFSKPESGLYLFSYSIHILNSNNFQVRLLRRHWHILDSSTNKREVEGEGVIGLQPIISPNESYSYTSSCDFMTDTGQMRGQYVMLNLKTGEEFTVDIPSFMLMMPHRLN